MGQGLSLEQGSFILIGLKSSLHLALFGPCFLL